MYMTSIGSQDGGRTHGGRGGEGVKSSDENRVLQVRSE